MESEDFSSTSAIPHGKCQCGCGGITKLAAYNRPKYGWVKGQPVNYIRGHFKRTPAPWRFKLEPNTGCWLWQGRVNTDGYACADINQIGVHVHRVIYERCVGPISADKVLDHLCRVRHCINFKHLEPVSNLQNIRRGNLCRVSADEVKAMRQMYQSGASLKSVHEAFPRTRKTNVLHILQNKTWKDIAV